MYKNKIFNEKTLLLNNALTVQTTEFNPVDYGWSSGSGNCKKSGNIVVVNFAVTKSEKLNNTTAYKICNLPYTSEHYTVSVAYAFIVNGTTEQQNGRNVEIQVIGKSLNIYVRYGEIPANMCITGQITYITND